jgi:hypothetical protein
MILALTDRAKTLLEHSYSHGLIRAARDSHLNQANKLSRTYATLLESLNKHRGKGQQKVTVEHVHVHQGGQAIVGHVEHKREGGREKKGGSTPCKGD